MSDINIKHICWAILFAGYTSLPARAEPQLKMTPAVNDAVASWGACQGKEILTLSQPALSPDIISDAVMEACHSFEQQTRQAISKQTGQDRAVQLVDNLREMFRKALIDDVVQERGGSRMAADPSGEWGKCVGEAIRDLGTDVRGANDLAAQARTKCIDSENAAYDVMLAQSGKSYADDFRAAAATVISKLAIGFLAEH